MNNLGLFTLILFQLFAEAEQRPKLNLYQIGAKGRYCVSLTPNENGCISGANAEGNPVNVLDLYAGYDLVFSNLSDVIHDMKTEGNNSQAGVQPPNGPDAILKMDNPDSEKRAVTCSLHGKQLGFGYTVSDKINSGQGDGHRLTDSIDGRPSGTDQGEIRDLGFTTGLNVKPTQLFDVADFVMKSGTPLDRKQLIDQRPELKFLATNDNPSNPGEAKFPKLTRTGLNFVARGKNSKPFSPYNSGDFEDDQDSNFLSMANKQTPLTPPSNNEKSLEGKLTLPPGAGLVVTGPLNAPFLIIVAAKNAVGFEGQLVSLTHESYAPKVQTTNSPRSLAQTQDISREIAGKGTPRLLDRSQFMTLMMGIVLFLAVKKLWSFWPAPILAFKKRRPPRKDV